MSIQQMETFTKELEGWRDRLKELPGQVDMPHVLSAACYILAGQVERLIRHVGYEIEARELTAMATEDRRPWEP